MAGEEGPRRAVLHGIIGDSSQAAIFVGALTILLGFAVSAATSRNGVIPTVLMATALVLLAFLNALLVALFVRSHQLHDLNQVSIRLQEVVAAAEYDWIISDELLASWETTRPWDKITVVSPDLSIDTGSGPFVTAVKANIQRGVKYHYVVPSNPLVQGRLPALRQMFQKRLDILTIAQVDPKLFHILPVHIVVYEDSTVPGDIPLVVMEAPSGDRHWLRFSETNASAVIGSIINLSSAQVSQPPPSDGGRK